MYIQEYRKKLLEKNLIYEFIVRRKSIYCSNRWNFTRKRKNEKPNLQLNANCFQMFIKILLVYISH